jgi:DUF4097 and DUF4098 domain-containing protein YvlB
MKETGAFMRFDCAVALAGLTFIAAAEAAAQPAWPRPVSVRVYALTAAAPPQAEPGTVRSDTFSRRVRLGPDGRVSVSNIAGDIAVTAGPGEDVSIEAIKRTPSRRGDSSRVRIDVEERPGRVVIRTSQAGRDRVSVDYTITVPAGASVDLKSVSGNVKVSGVRGVVRAQSVSGNVTTVATPRVEMARSLSGNVEIADISADGDLAAGSLSGYVRGRALRVRSLNLNSVSGNVVIDDVACQRLDVKSISGEVEFMGALARGGRYTVTSHSGNVRLRLAGGVGFELDATSFSGMVRSEFPVTLSADPRQRRRNRSIHATFGDGSAMISVTTFSGQVTIARR